jgi:hypothetical protein
MTLSESENSRHLCEKFTNHCLEKTAREKSKCRDADMKTDTTGKGVESLLCPGEASRPGFSPGSLGSGVEKEKNRSDSSC